jgi:hypothetical protein
MSSTTSHRNSIFTPYVSIFYWLPAQNVEETVESQCCCVVTREVLDLEDGVDY